MTSAPTGTQPPQTPVAKAPRPGRVLVWSGALLWGLQFSFLSPALALLLVALYDATPAQVGTVLAIYNASGFVAALVLPAYADRKKRYLQVMVLCGVLTVALAVLLAAVSSLLIVTVGLVVLGGPAVVGNSMLFAHLRNSGASRSDVVNTRAIVSAAWVFGPALSTFIIDALGKRAILVAIAVIALLGTINSTAMLRVDRSAAGQTKIAAQSSDEAPPVRRSGLVLIVAAFIALAAANSATTSVMTLFVTDSLKIDLKWAGITLGVAAALEIPALLLAGRLTRRFSNLALVTSGAVAAIAYYTAMVFVTGPVVLIAIQVLNAWFVATLSGIGMTLFQEIILRPGLATGLYTNTRRVGSIAAGPLIAFGSATSLRYGGIFAACAGLAVVSLVATAIAGRLVSSGAQFDSS